jgi:hypothetical protein
MFYSIYNMAGTLTRVIAIKSINQVKQVLTLDLDWLVVHSTQGLACLTCIIFESLGQTFKSAWLLPTLTAPGDSVSRCYTSHQAAFEACQDLLG